MCLCVFLCSQAARSGALNCCTRNNNAYACTLCAGTQYIIIVWSVTCALELWIWWVFMSLLLSAAAARCQWMCAWFIFRCGVLHRWSDLPCYFPVCVFVLGTNFSSQPILSIHIPSKWNSKLMAYSQPRIYGFWVKRSNNCGDAEACLESHISIPCGIF